MKSGIHNIIRRFIMKRIVVLLSAMLFVAITLCGCQLPIVAINNSMLRLAADSGSGTAADPYIIENKAIDMAGKNIYHSGIHLMYTNAHLIIRHVTIKNGNIALTENKSAILLQGVSNVTVESCTFENNYIGIMLENSSAVNVFDNTVVNNRAHGIYLKGSSNCVVKDNSVRDSGAIDILLEYNPYSDIWITPSVCQYNQILDNKTAGTVALYGNGTTSYNTIRGNSLGGVPATVIESPGAGENNIIS
jgi:parallel beta-helix repeat protein